MLAERLLREREMAFLERTEAFFAPHTPFFDSSQTGCGSTSLFDEAFELLDAFSRKYGVEEIKEA